MATATKVTPTSISRVHTLITPDDKTRLVVFTASFLMVCSVLFLMTRIWIRWPILSLFAIDDILTTAGTVVAAVQSLIVACSVRYGFGHRMNTGSRPKPFDFLAGKLIFSSHLFYITSLCLGKLAITTLFERLAASVPFHRKIARALSALVLTWGIASLIVMGVRGSSNQPYRHTLHESAFRRWLGIEIVGGILELCFVAFAIRLVWNMTMTTKEKIMVVSGFALRLPIIPMIALRLASLATRINSHDPAFEYVLPEIYTQLEMHFNLIAATFPCLRIFLRGFRTVYLVGHAQKDRVHSRTSFVMTSDEIFSPIMTGISISSPSLVVSFVDSLDEQPGPSLRKPIFHMHELNGHDFSMGSSNRHRSASDPEPGPS